MTLSDLIGLVRRFDPEALYNTFIGLPARQQTIALVSVIGGLLLALFLPITIAGSYLGGLQEEIDAAQTQMDKALQQIRRHETLRRNFAGYETFFQGQSSDSVVPAIQRIAGEVGVPLQPPPAERGRESFDIYEEEKASFTMKGVSLEQLVKMLHALESATSRVMRVRELIVAPVYGNRALLNAEVKEIAAYRLVTEERARPEKPAKPGAKKK